ncbi:tryptophan-rich protein [Plasmodium ovale]|nr:tryptophan-rich protein [Plasmodium ovale]
MKAVPTVSYKLKIIFVLLSAFFSSYASARNPSYPKYPQNYITYLTVAEQHADPLDGIIKLQRNWKTFLELNEEEMNKIEKLKEEEWDKWIEEVQTQWSDFRHFLYNKKSKWIQKKNQEWTKWIKAMEKKWMNYRINIDRGILPSNLRNAITYDDMDTSYVIRKDVQNKMTNDLKKWISSNDANLYKWILRDWNTWKENRMKEWNSRKWKVSEDEYWKEHTYSIISIDPLFLILKNSRAQWEERKKREGEQWKKFTNILEGKYLSINHNEWEKWKEDKFHWYNEWMTYFLNSL